MTLGLGGCGGGGGSSSLPTPTPSASVSATITGTVLVDNQDSTGSKSGVSGVAVTYTGANKVVYTTTTASDGTFTLPVSAGQTGLVKLTVSSGYYDAVTYSNNGTATAGSIASGFAIPSLTTGASYSLGNIVLEPTTGPPPPPPNI